MPVRIPGMDASERTPPAPPALRRPLIVAAAVITLIVIAGSLVWTARTLQSNRLNRWLPERSGSAVVQGKSQRGTDYLLEIRLDVPAAAPVEAALIPDSVDGRETMVAARSFDATVHVDRAQWDAARPGMRVRALYHINAQRSDVFVPTVYLDAMETGTQ